MKIAYVVFDFDMQSTAELVEILKIDCDEIYYSSPYGKFADASAIPIKSKDERSETFSHEYFSVIETVLSKSKFTHLVILNSKNFPIRPICEFHDYLNEYFESDHVNLFFEKRSGDFYNLSSNNLFINRLLKLLKLKRKTPWGFVLHVGSPYGCITRKTAENAMTIFKGENLTKYFKHLNNSPFYFIPYVMRRSLERPDLMRDSFIGSTSKITCLSNMFYDDHACIFECGGDFFAYAVSRSSRKLRLLHNEKNRPRNGVLQPVETYENFIKSINSSNKRIPGICFNDTLKDLACNRKRYAVVIAVSDFKIDELKNYFNESEYIVVGELFDDDSINYYVKQHPCYDRDAVALRNFMIHAFVYDIVNYYEKKVVFVVKGIEPENIINLLVSDDNSTFYGLLEEKMKKLLTARIQVTPEKASQHYEIDYHAGAADVEDGLLEANTESMRSVVGLINSISSAKRKLVKIL